MQTQFFEACPDLSLHFSLQYSSPFKQENIEFVFNMCGAQPSYLASRWLWMAQTMKVESTNLPLRGMKRGGGCSIITGWGRTTISRKSKRLWQT
ncbi:putative oxidoreductase alpha (Molybdopterin) subunit [Synechococcus sp. ROS8604]|nr:putative oxidoreductase alpha (Molybdopterin) subunit [Synechococcus sp. ROS8604]